MTCCATTRSGAPKTPALVAGVFLFLAVAGCSGQNPGSAAGAARWQPASTDTIVFSLPDATDETASLYELRRNLANNVDDPAAAAQFAAVALKNYAESGDPRMLGYVAGALSAWRDSEHPPLRIWLLRGRLAQTEHQFELAASDMDRLLAAHPGNIEALLLAADAWRRAGDLAAARGRCLQLSLAGESGLARLCGADIQLSLGLPGRALQTATAAIAGDSSLKGEALSWAYAIRAEAATAAGETATALDSWQAAFAAAESPPLALRLGHVDTLLAAGRFSEALQQLASLPPADAVLLRRAIAGNALQHGDLEQWRAELQQRFANPAYKAADSLHWRERAMFELDVLHEPDDALQSALRNWSLQKGYEDAELLIRAAAATGDQSAAQIVADWRTAQGGA